MKEISISIWAMAKLGYHPGRILADFGRRVEELVPGFSSQAISNTMWGLAVLQVAPLPLPRLICHRLCRDVQFRRVTL
jgi:hypothetical protein